jgi:hypothetical protein
VPPIRDLSLSPCWPSDQSAGLTTSPERVCLEAVFLNEAPLDRRDLRLGIAKRVRRRAPDRPPAHLQGPGRCLRPDPIRVPAATRSRAGSRASGLLCRARRRATCRLRPASIRRRRPAGAGLIRLTRRGNNSLPCPGDAGLGDRCERGEPLGAGGQRGHADTLEKENIAPGTLTLHADRGTSMRSKPVAALLIDLEVAKTSQPPARLG